MNPEQFYNGMWQCGKCGKTYQLRYFAEKCCKSDNKFKEGKG